MMYRGFMHADQQYNADLEAARLAYSRDSGNDSRQAIARYRDARSRAMQEAARRYAQQIGKIADR